MENADCLDTEGSYECICSTGYSGDGLVNCESESQMHPRCQHTSTSMISVCIQGHAKGKLMCPCGLFLPDVNECTEDTHMCDDVAMCSDTVGSYTCTCITGYTGFTCNGNHTERHNMDILQSTLLVFHMLCEPFLLLAAFEEESHPNEPI